MNSFFFFWYVELVPRGSAPCSYTLYIYIYIKLFTGRLPSNTLLRNPTMGWHVTIFLQSKVVSLVSNPPTWRVRSLYLCPPVTGWPIIPPGTWFHFRHLLRLAGLRWRYSTPPPYGDLSHITPCNSAVCSWIVVIKMSFERIGIYHNGDIPTFISTRCLWSSVWL
jgi:hypothetical protein